MLDYIGWSLYLWLLFGRSYLGSQEEDSDRSVASIYYD